MSSFDYNAPAELFLSKPTKGSRTKYWRFSTAAAFATPSRICGRREPSALGCRLATSASTVLKSSASQRKRATRRSCHRESSKGSELVGLGEQRNGDALFAIVFLHQPLHASLVRADKRSSDQRPKKKLVCLSARAVQGVVVSGQTATLHFSRRVNVIGHKFKIGQRVNYLRRERASGVYQDTQLLPVEGEYFKIALRTPTSPTSD